jgi:hypothetical protein
MFLFASLEVAVVVDFRGEINQSQQSKREKDEKRK